jgi:hypothetical protein
MRLSNSATAVAVAALVLVSGGAYALGSSSGGGLTITVCVSHKGGALYQARKCASRDRKLSWNEQGPQGIQGRPGQPGIQGSQGIQGLKGDQGPAGSARGYGSVPSSCAPNPSPPTTCTLSASSNASVTHPYTGIYCISVPNVTPADTGAIATLENNSGDLIAYINSLSRSCPQSSFEIQILGPGPGGNADSAFFFAVP